MEDIFEAARWASDQIEGLDLAYAIIGGVALQAWGEPRLTRDVDLSVLVGFDEVPAIVERLLERIPPRVDWAIEHALRFRVFLGQTRSGIGIDIGMAGFTYEIEALARSRVVEFVPGIALRVIGPEDLVIMKVFAGRARDWEDVEGVLARQRTTLEWDLIESALPALLDAIVEPERMARLQGMRSAIEGHGPR